MTIPYKGKMKIPANAIDQLITASQSDIRQALNMLLMRQLSNNIMDLNEVNNLYVKKNCLYLFNDLRTSHVPKKM
ncbi:hypothetical protein F4604DRAFT_1812239, partial [Suillus subluteus]